MNAHTPGPWTWREHVLEAQGFPLCEHVACRDEDRTLIAAAPTLLAACEATLLFYTAAYWSEAERERWFRLTGYTDATTVILAEINRKAVAAALGST